MADSKKLAAGAWLSLASMVALLGALVAYCVLSFDGERTPRVVYVLGVLAMAVQVCMAVAQRSRLGGRLNSTSVLSAILISAAFVQMMLGRIEWLGGLAAHNASLAPMHTSFYVTAALFVAALVLACAAAFLPQLKEDA